MKKIYLFIFILFSIIGIKNVYASDTHDLTVTYEKKGNAAVEEDLRMYIGVYTYEDNVSGNLTIIDENGNETSRIFNNRNRYEGSHILNSTNNTVVIKNVPTGATVDISYFDWILGTHNSFYYTNIESSNNNVDLSSYNGEYTPGLNYNDLNFERVLEDEDENVHVTIGSLSGNYEKNVIIQVKQELENLQIKKGLFTYYLKDLEDNVIETTTNDEDGNVIFDSLVVNNSDVGNDKTMFYKITQEANDKEPFEYDQNIIYVTVNTDYGREGLSTKVAYLKDDGDDSENKYNYHYKGEVFHATEEDLQGQAYAVLDRDTGVLTFFRDEPNKYTYNQTIGNKTYYTGLEDGTGSGGWAYSYDVKEIIFKDAVKPQSIQYWFYYLRNLEKADIAKLDTSLITSLDYFFSDCPKLKELDISTMDVANVNTMFRAFHSTQLEYLDLTAWNLNQELTRFQMSEMAVGMTKLKYLNISNLGDWSSSAEFANQPCLEKLVIGDRYDFYRSNIDGYGPDMWYNPAKNRIDNYHSIYYNIWQNTESMAGYYLRPSCTYSASLKNVYHEDKDVLGKYKTSSTLKNPETKDKILTILIIVLVSMITLLLLEKKRKEL